jgi:hypothetical protein
MSQKISVFGKIALRNSKLEQQPNRVINWKKIEKHTKATALFVFSHEEATNLSFSEALGRSWGPPNLQSCGHRASFGEVIRMGREDGPTSPFSAEGKNEWSYSSIRLAITSRRGRGQIYYYFW